MKTVFPNIPEIEETNKIAAALFGTDEDETQAKPTLENALALISVEKNNFICLKDGDAIIAWSVVLPTSKEMMGSFLAGDMNEKELFSAAIKNPAFEALYLTAVIVLPEYQKKGMGSSLMKGQIEYFKNKYGINSFYALILTKEGKKLMGTLERELGTKIHIREK